MKTLLLLLIGFGAAVAARGQEYGPFDLALNGGSVTYEVATSSGTLLVSAGSSGGGTGGRNYAFSEARNGSSISGWGNERITFSGVGEPKLVAAYYWWVSLSEDGSWGYYDELKIYVRLAASPPQPNRAPTIAWSSAPAGAPDGAGYFVAARGQDADGNLAQVNVWKGGTSFATGSAGDGSERESGNWTSDAGPRSVTFTAQAVDSDGAVSPLISTVVTIDAPAVTTHTLVVNAGPGGYVSGGGNYPNGTSVTAMAAPDASHVFSGWTGDIGGAANPLTVTLDRDISLTANFALRQFMVVTGTSGGGSVSAGGVFPFGAFVTLNATADSAHWFSGWGGDASGTANPVAVVVDRTKYIQAIFSAKATQTISVTPLGQLAPGAVVTVVASASSGLPVSLAVVDGPGRLDGNVLTVTGTGPITIEANQGGDTFTLAASPVRLSTSVAVGGVVRVQRTPRTLLGSESHFLIGNP
ncbi:MAG: hypothetical protein KF715_19755 [Candidatus Didemnitutus sp.]|nr:hypothetical protein [Candidatus Didemnitutus sp.]